MCSTSEYVIFTASQNKNTYQQIGTCPKVFWSLSENFRDYIAFKTKFVTLKSIFGKFNFTWKFDSERFSLKFGYILETLESCMLMVIYSKYSKLYFSLFVIADLDSGV